MSKLKMTLRQRCYLERHYLASIFCLLLCMASSVEADANEVPAYALTNAHIFNGVDKKIISNRTLLVRNGLIEANISSSDQVPTGYQVVDCENNYLLPGLIDVHTHLETLEQVG